MRLLVATPLYPPEPGGPATYARALELGLPARGFEISIVPFSEVRRMPRFLRHIAYFWNVFKAAKTADAVLALDPVSVGLPAWCAARLRRKPFIVKVVGDYAWEQGRQRFGVWLALDDFVHSKQMALPVYLLRVVQTTVAKNAAAVIVPSEYLKRIVSVWGVPEGKIRVVYNARPTQAPSSIPESVAALTRPRIVTSGRLVPWKGMHGVIAAMIGIRKRIPSAELVVIGDGPEREALERYAKVRLGKGYTFTGALAHNEALAVMADADVFVLNSSYEGLSHILIEALELGKAIVATKAGGNPELIRHEENGLLISVGDSEALAAACISILEDSVLAARLETHARESAVRYSPEAMLDATAAVLAGIV